MKTRLALCSTYLEEVEAKMRELLAMPGNDNEAKIKLMEAMSFVRQARLAISETQARVQSLFASDKSERS